MTIEYIYEDVIWDSIRQYMRAHVEDYKSNFNHFCVTVR